MDYVLLFNNFIELVDKEFTKCEKYSEDGKYLHDLARHMPALIGLTNTIGYLRGQDGCFLDFRPRTDQQDHFFKQEKAFEKRLQVLIDRLLNSSERDFYEKRLHSYFTLVRTNRDAEVW